MKFSDIYGQENIIRRFQVALESDRVPHAIIINGEKGSGKKMLAKTFAAALECEKGGPAPCMECKNCKQAFSNNHPDIIWLTHEKAAAGVDEIREQVVNDIVIKPYSGKYKIYIIPDAQDLNNFAQNAILKTIEEPPEYAIIILLTTNMGSLLSTIISRCVEFAVKPVNEDVIEKHLIQNGISPDEAKVAASFACGNVGKAMLFASDEHFKEMLKLVTETLISVRGFDALTIEGYAKKAAEYKAEIDSYFDMVTVWYRDVLVYKATQNMENAVFFHEKSAIATQAASISYKGLDDILTAVTSARSRIRYNISVENAVEMMLLMIRKVK